VVKKEDRVISLGFHRMARPLEAPSMSMAMTLQLLQHLMAIFSIFLEVNLVSCFIIIEGFSLEIKVFKDLCLLGLLRHLTFHGMYLIGKVGGRRRIFLPYS
jgi:hypothetical protein